MPRTRRTMFYSHEMKVMLLPLILCLLQMQAKVRSEELHCRPRTANTTSPMQLDEAISMAQCHMGCVRKYVNVTVALEMETSEHQRWSHLTTSDILDYGSCITLQNVMECRRGCFLRSKSPQVTRTACRQQCVSECRDECGSGDVCGYAGTECPLTCKKSLCGVGCILAPEIHTGSGGAPLTPQQPFELTRAESSSKPLPGGLYTVGITEDQEEQGSSFSVLIVQVEINGSSFYFPLTSLKDVLDIGRFMCHTVNVSYAVINQSDISDFSPALELTIYGEDAYPAQLPYNGIQYEWVEDTRPGYERTAVVNITWEPPEGYQYISSYHLVMFSQTDECGGQIRMMSFMGIGNRPYFVWKAMKSYRMPVIHCTYQARITANPCRDHCTTPLQIIIVDTNSMKDNSQPKMNLTCHKYENITTGIISVYIQWEVENTSRMIETIKNYQIMTKLMDTRMKIPFLLKTLFSQKILANGSSQVAHLVHGLTPDTDSYHEIVIRVTPAINEDYDWRQIPAYQECRVDIYPSQPSFPSATVAEFFVNDTTVFLNLSLIAPSTPHGAVETYEVVLVREPVPAEEDPLSLNLVRRTLLELDNGNQNGILNVENADSAYRHIDDSTLCLFLHIRARNEFLWSDWSDAILLDRYPETSINCTALQEPQNKISLHTYIAVSLCAVAVAVITIMSTFIANYLYKRHRIKQQMNTAFQTPGYVNPVFRKYETKRRSSALWLPVDAPRADDWELPSDNILLTEEEPLGEGCFGTVHRGVVKGPIIHSRMMKNTICINVAIKFLKKTATGSERSDFLTEIETMKQVAEGNNPHVVNMIGCVTLQEPICLVTEFVKYGDLLTYLCTIRNVVTAEPGEEIVEIDANDKEPELDTVKEVVCTDEGVDALSAETQCASYDRLNPYANLGDLEPVNLISFAYQIASGMEYLSSLGVVHRDLACRNILVGDGKQLKISDFGMARTTVDEVYVKSTKSRLPWKWMAMESIMSRVFTSATDVWAYGVTLWEIATLGGFPYPSTPNGELLEYLRRGNRLECPTNCSQEIYDIMLKCWQDTPDKRPSFTELKTTFAEMLQKNNPYIQLDNINMQKSYYNPHPPEDSLTGSRKQSDERLNDSECAPPISSSSSSSSDSAPLEASNVQLLSCTNAGEMATMSLEEQQAPLGPPNLYVDTPTTENQFPLEAAAAEPPALQPSVDAETEV